MTGPSQTTTSILSLVYTVSIHQMLANQHAQSELSGAGTTLQHQPRHLLFS